MAIPMAIAAGTGLFWVVIPAFQRLASSGAGGDVIVKLRAVGARTVLLLLFLYGAGSARAVVRALPASRAIVTAEELEMMVWIEHHVGRASSFLVIGDEIEWFPEITQRPTVNVVYGSEWAEDDCVFRLERDTRDCRTAECYLEAARRYGMAPDHLYISKSPESLFMIQLAKGSGRLRVIKENAGAALFSIEG